MIFERIVSTIKIITIVLGLFVSVAKPHLLLCRNYIKGCFENSRLGQCGCFKVSFSCHRWKLERQHTSQRFKNSFDNHCISFFSDRRVSGFLFLYAIYSHLHKVKTILFSVGYCSSQFHFSCLTQKWDTAFSAFIHVSQSNFVIQFRIVINQHMMYH